MLLDVDGFSITCTVFHLVIDAILCSVDLDLYSLNNIDLLVICILLA